MTFGEAVKEARKNKKLTQLDVSFLCGVTSSMINQIERESKAPSIEVLAKLCTHLDLSVDKIFNLNK